VSRAHPSEVVPCRLTYAEADERFNKARFARNLLCSLAA
jgi:hypothetical protein